MSDVPFAFALIPGEDVFARWLRLWRTLLADGPIDHATTPVRLASFLDVASPGSVVGMIGGKPVADVSAWRTNCAMAQHAAQVWCGRELPPYVNGQPIAAYVDLARGGDLWVENDGAATPTGPCIFYVDPSARLPYDHVGTFGVSIGDRVYTTYEGGGGDGTRIGASARHLDEPDAYGRRIAGWWAIASLLPAKPPPPGGPADDAADPHEAETEPGV